LAETDTDAVEQLDAPAAPQRKFDEGTPRLWQRYRRLPRNVFAISLVSLLNDASSEIIYPLLPLFLSVTLGASPAIIGYIEGAAESVSSLLKLFAGYFSDRRSKRKGLVVFGYGLASFARPVLAFATSWPQVFAIRLIDRVGKGIRSAPRDAMIADSVSVKERGLAFGFHRAMDHAGAVIGPLIGYVLIYFIAADRNALAAIDYKTIFLVASVPAMAAVFVVGWLVRETPPEQRAGMSGGANSKAAANNKADANNNAAQPPRLSLRGFDGNFKIFLLLVALFTLSNSTDAFLIKRANEVGVSMLYIPLLWAALHAVKVLSSLIGGDLSDRLGRRTLIVSGWLLYAAVYAGFAFITSAGAAWALFLIYGIYFGLAEGTEKALVADLVRPEQRGTAFGLYNLAFGITVLPASILMGKLWAWYGAQAAFIVSAIIGAGAALLLLFLVRTEPPELSAQT
jgi:MFS family permease